MIQTVKTMNENTKNLGQYAPATSQSMSVVMFQLFTTINVNRVINEDVKSLKFSM